MLGRAIILLIAIMGCLTTQVYALGLGEVTLESTLNQPLQARIELLDLGDAKVEDIAVQMATVGDFERFNIDRSRFLSNIKFSVKAIAGRNYVVLVSTQVVREPYISFILDTRWPSGRLLSEHTLLLDLPVFDDKQKTAAPILPVSRSGTLSASADSNAALVSTPNRIASAQARPTIVSSPVSTAPIQQPNPTPTVVASAPQAELVLEQNKIVADALEPVIAEDAVVQAAEQLSETAGEVAAAAVEAVASDTGAAEILRLAEAITEEAAEVPESVEISASDTLWSVALRVRPDASVSVQQTMLAIQRLNPDAFAEGNINRLLSGEVIKVPDLSEIRSVDQEQAIAEVSRQNQATGIGVEPLSAPADGPSTQIAPQQGQLSVVTVDSSTENSTNAAGPLAEENAELDNRIVDLENRLALSQENADRADIERDELTSRLGSIELQIDSAREIIDLQDLQLAQLQQTMGNAANANVEVAETEAETETDETIAAALPAAATQAGTSGPAAPGASQPGLLENLLATLENNLIMAGAGIGVVVLLLILLMLRRNRDEEFEEVSMAGVSDEAFAAADGEALALASSGEHDSLDDSLKDLQVDSAAEDLEDLVDLGADLEEDVLQEVGADFDAADMVEESSLETTEGVLEQVAVFIQYKQIDKARELLENRLATEPENTQLQLKLAEIFAEQHNESAFAEQEAKLKTVADATILAQLAVLKLKFTTSDNDDSGFTDGLDELAEFDTEATTDTQDLAGTDVDSSFDSVDFGTDNEFAATADDAELVDEIEDDAEIVDEIEEIDAEEIAELTVTDDVDELESFSFDIDKKEDVDPVITSVEHPEKLDKEASVDFGTDSDSEQSEFEASESALSLAESEPEVADDNTVEFDLDDQDAAGKDSEADDIAVLGTAAAAEAPVDEDSNSDEIESFDFDLASLDGDTVVEKPMFSSDAKDDGNSDDFDFDLDEFEVENETRTTAEQGTDLDLDEEIKELDMEEVSADATQSSTDINDTDAIDFDLNSAMDFATEVKTDTSDKPDYSGSALDNLEFATAEEDSQLTDSSDDDYGDMDMLSEDDEAATKLELAYAYQKMGDDSGAREILEEIITEGSGAQINEARELLNSLGPAK